MEKARLAKEAPRGKETEVYVMSVGDGLVKERMQICKQLWGAGIKVSRSSSLSSSVVVHSSPSRSRRETLHGPSSSLSPLFFSRSRFVGRVHVQSQAQKHQSSVRHRRPRRDPFRHHRWIVRDRGWNGQDQGAVDVSCADSGCEGCGCERDVDEEDGDGWVVEGEVDLEGLRLFEEEEESGLLRDLFRG